MAYAMKFSPFRSPPQTLARNRAPDDNQMLFCRRFRADALARYFCTALLGDGSLNAFAWGLLCEGFVVNVRQPKKRARKSDRKKWTSAIPLMRKPSACVRANGLRPTRRATSPTAG